MAQLTRWFAAAWLCTGLIVIGLLRHSRAEQKAGDVPVFKPHAFFRNSAAETDAKNNPSSSDGILDYKSLAFSPNGKRLYAASTLIVAQLAPAQRRIRPVFGVYVLECWDVAQRKLLWWEDYACRGAGLTDFSLSPDGKLLAVGQAGKVSLHSAEDGKPVRALELKLDDKTGVWESVRAVTFSPDGKWVAGAVSSYKYKSNVEAPEHTGSWLQLWDVASGKPVARWDLGAHYRNQVRLAFSSDGKALAIAGDHPSITLRDPLTGKVLRTWKVYDEQKPNPRVGHATIVNDLKHARLGEQSYWIAANGYAWWDPKQTENEGLVDIWTDNGELVRTLPHDGSVSALAVFPDQKRFVSGERSKRPKAWPKPLPPMPPPRPVEEFHSEVYLWELPTGRRLATFHVGELEVTGLAVAPDGRWVAGCYGGSRRNASSILLWPTPANLP